MVFVQDPFDCVSRSLVIQLTVFFLFICIGHSIDLHLERHSIAFFSLNHSIVSVFCVRSIASQTGSSECISSNMTVTTRSMAKRQMAANNTTSLFEISNSTNHCDLHIDDTSSLSLNGSQEASSSVSKFEISKFGNTLSLLQNLHIHQSHFSGNFKQSIMESDCEDNKFSELKNETSSSASADILNMLGAISSQMMIGHQDLQKQNLQLSQELQKVIADTDQFKREIRAELGQLQSPGSLSSSTSTPMISVTSSASTPVVSPGPSLATAGASTDFQAQMLALLNQTFTQLTTVIQETKTVISEGKGSDSKSEWPKFSGDTKKF